MINRLFHKGTHSQRLRRKYGINFRLIIIVIVSIGILSAIFPIIRFISSPSTARGTSTALPTDLASYLGVYEKGAPDTYQPVKNFAKAINKQPNLVGYYSGWREPFKASFAKTVHEYGAATIVQIDPTNISMSAIAGGYYDTYLRSFAQSVRAFRYPVIIGFGHEMNANWYSWGYGNTSPALFVAAWRHIVILFRKQAVHNVTWLWTVQADEYGTGPIARWWPGASYVTWVGIDGYYYRSYETFSSIFGKTITQVRTITSRPVLLSEAAVGPLAGQEEKIPDLFGGMRQYGTLGLIWFDIAQSDGLYHQDWRIEHRLLAVKAFRREASALRLATVNDVSRS
jgi:mannan endo-1,4-beta-mannosidase